MTEKVVLTKEQAEAIEENLHRGWALSDMVFRHKEGWESVSRTCLNSLEIDDFIRALYIGYEVEPEFKVGDWVKCNQFSGVYQVTKENQFAGIIELDNNGGGVHESHLRHATPSEIAEEKERRWWKKHGREPWELKKYDRIKCKTTDKEYEILDVEKPLRFEVLDMRDVHLRNVEFYSTQQISSRFVVVCFTENRLDVKTDD